MKDFKNFFTYTIMTVLQKSVSFLFVPFITTFLTPEEFGFVNHLTAISSAFVLFLLFALDEATSRFYFDNRNDVKKISSVISTNITISILISIFFVFILFLSVLIFGSNVFLGFGQQYFMILVILSVATPIYYIQLKVFRIQGKAFLFSLFSVLNILIQIGCFILFVVFFDYGSIGYLYSITLSTLLMCLLSLFTLFNGISYSPSLEIAKSSILFSLKVFPHTISSWGLYGLTIIVIGYYINNKGVGIFSILNYLCVIMAVITNSVLYSFQPWLYEMLESNRKNIVVSVISFLSYLLIVISFVLSLFSDYFIKMVFSSEYYSNIYIAPMLITVNIVLFIGSLHTYILYFSKSNTSKVAYATILGALINCILISILIKPLGLLGAALSLLCAHFIISFLKQYYSLKYLDVNKRLDFPIYLFCILNVFISSLAIYYNISFICRILLSFFEVLIFVFLFRDVIISFLLENNFLQKSKDYFKFH